MVSRCEDNTVTDYFLDEMPKFYINTFSELEKHPKRFAEVSESDVENFDEGKKMQTLKNFVFLSPKEEFVTSSTYIC